MQYDVINRAERDLIGCVLVDTERTIREIRSIVSASDFTSSACRAIYEAALSLLDSGKAADPTQILAHAAERGEAVEEAWAAEVMRQYVTTANATATAELVHKAAIDRASESVGSALALGQISTTDAVAQLQELMQRQGAKMQTPLEAAHNFMDYVTAAHSGEIAPFISTGFASLDNQLSGGFVSSGLITLAARPGTGKTTAALNLAERVAERGQSVLYFSLEMDSRQLWARRTGAYSGLSYSHVYRGNIQDKDWKRFTDATAVLSRHPFYIYDKPCTIEDIERTTRSMEAPALIVIDHIGLVKNNAGRSRYELMTDTAHRLKQLALSTGVPILALCQLNRQSEARESKLPTTADLRDTGAIEEDSDVVMLLHRPAMYAAAEDRPQPWEEQELQIIVGKNRHGMQGTVSLGFMGMTARIMEASR